MNMQCLFPAWEQQPSPVCLGNTWVEFSKQQLKLLVQGNILNVQNADDAGNANEGIHIYGIKFCPWVGNTDGQEVYLGAIPWRSITPCVVMLMGNEINFQG